MKMIKSVALAALAVAVITQTAQAAKVVGIAAGAGSGTVFSLGAATFATPTENNITPGPGGPANTIYLPITVFEKHTPFEILLTLDETGTPGPINSTSYTVTVDLTHAVPGSPGNAINGFDVTAVGATTPIVHALSKPISSSFTIEEPQPLPGGTFRYGGLNGGGTGQLLFGDTATSTFDLVLTSFSSSGPIVRSLSFVANPEPGSILLGSLALLPIGIAVRRRRKQPTEVAVD